MRVSFSNNVDVKVTINPLFDDLKSDNIIFLLFSSLDNCGGISLRSIDYIPELFFLKYSLNKVGPLRPVVKVMGFFFFTFTVVVFVCYFDNLKEDKNIILI